jgi:hypothetical protein
MQVKVLDLREKVNTSPRGATAPSGGRRPVAPRGSGPMSAKKSLENNTFSFLW